MLRHKLFGIRPFHFRKFFSTIANSNVNSRSLFAQFVSSKFNISEADISKMFKSAPSLQELQTLHNLEQFIHTLNKRGFVETQIANLMRTQPTVICLSAEINLEPKIKLLEDFGFRGQNLRKLLTINPKILTLSLEDDLLPKMKLLKNGLQCQRVLVKAVLRAPRVLDSSLEKTLKPSLAFWGEWGFRGMELYGFLRLHPVALSRTSLTSAQVDLIHKVGAVKGSKIFKHVLSVVTFSRVETLEAKMESLELCGLSTEEVWRVFRTAPRVFRSSKESLSEKMNFIINSMELPPNYAVKHPRVLLVSLEKTTRPRFLVWQKIISINDPGLSFLTVLNMTQARFVSKIIKGHPESTTLWSIYRNAISDASNWTKISTKSRFWIDILR